MFVEELAPAVPVGGLGRGRRPAVDERAHEATSSGSGSLAPRGAFCERGSASPSGSRARPGRAVGRRGAVGVVEAAADELDEDVLEARLGLRSDDDPRAQAGQRPDDPAERRRSPRGRG